MFLESNTDLRNIFSRNNVFCFAVTQTINCGCVRAATNESQETLNKCETRNKTVFHTRLRHPETINSVPLNSVLRIKQIGV